MHAPSMIVGGIVILCLVIGWTLNFDVWAQSSPQLWQDMELSSQVDVGVEENEEDWRKAVKEMAAERRAADDALKRQLTNLDHRIQELKVKLADSMNSLSTKVESSADVRESPVPSPVKETPSERPLSIGVMLAWWPPKWYMEMDKEEKQMIMTNRECYCRMHNYTLFVGSDIEVSHGYWAKLVHAKRVLTYSQVDWLFFGDMDFFITQFDRPLESFIKALPSKDQHLILPQEFDAHRRFSNFNFFIRNSKIGHKFLDIWLEEMQVDCNPNWPDQVAMWRSILRLLAPLTGADTNCTKSPDYCCRHCDLPYGGYSQAVCFDNTMAYELNCSPLTSQTCGPLYFTNSTAGLGLQAATLKSWDQVRPSMLSDSFGIHCKQHDIVCQAYKQTFQQHADGSCSVDMERARPSSSPLP